MRRPSVGGRGGPEGRVLGVGGSLKPGPISLARAWQGFERDGSPRDDAVEEDLRRLGAEVVRATRQVVRGGTCAYADDPRPGTDARIPAGMALSHFSLPAPGDFEGG